MVTNFSKNEPNIEAPVDLNTPIKYTSSRAHEHDPYETFLSRNKDRPWYQPYVVIASTSAFLLYFLFLREENDLDEELKKSLYEIIPGLEEEDLKAKLDNAKNMGIENKNLEKRLEGNKDRQNLVVSNSVVFHVIVIICKT